jgi:hypothetical protein
MDEKTLNQMEDEALGACHVASRALLLNPCARPQAVAAALLCERYARACADRAIEELSPAWASVYRVWHEAALDWLIIARVRDSGHLEV